MAARIPIDVESQERVKVSGYGPSEGKCNEMKRVAEGDNLPASATSLYAAGGIA